LEPIRLANQEVVLTVPAQPEFLRVARMTAAALGSRLGFTIDEVDDLRLALDELCFAIIGKGLADEQLRLAYGTGSGGLDITGSVTRSPDREPLQLGELSRQILTALVDDHRLWEDAGAGHFSLVKRTAASNA
jgi:serine/threonine-protein kinase RsbW